MKLALLFITLALISSCATLPTESDSTSVQFDLHDNRILVPVYINNQGPFTFVFDTGGARAHTMTPATAKTLGLNLAETKDATGAGGTAKSWTTTVQSYSIGDAKLENQKFDVLDLGAIQKAFKFPRLDGIVGFDVLKKSITCIDYEKKLLVLKNGSPDCFRGGTTIQFRLSGDTPVISGSVNGLRAEFVIDTGDRSAFSLFQKYARENRLDKLFEGKPEVITGVGVGGNIPARLGVVSEIKLGDEIVVKQVLARFPSIKRGYFATSPLAGSIGNEVLKRFNIALDYSKNTITLTKNSHFDEAFHFVPPVLGYRDLETR